MFNITSVAFITIASLSFGLAIAGLYMRDKLQRKEIERLKYGRLFLYVRLHRFSVLVNLLAQQCYDSSKNPEENKKYKDLVDESYELFHFIETLVGKMLNEILENPEAEKMYDFTVSNLKPAIRHRRFYDNFEKSFYNDKTS